MSAAIVWMDQENAKLFHFSTEKMARESIKAHWTEHHTHPYGEKNPTEKEHPKFFEDIIAKIKFSDQVLVMGPGFTKLHFMDYLDTHLKPLKQKVVGCETIDHPTDPEIAAMARRYFK